MEVQHIRLITVFLQQKWKFKFLLQTRFSLSYVFSHSMISSHSVVKTVSSCFLHVLTASLAIIKMLSIIFPTNCGTMLMKSLLFKSPAVVVKLYKPLGSVVSQQKFYMILSQCGISEDQFLYLDCGCFQMFCYFFF